MEENVLVNEMFTVLIYIFIYLYIYLVRRAKGSNGEWVKEWDLVRWVWFLDGGTHLVCVIKGGDPSFARLSILSYQLTLAIQHRRDEPNCGRENKGE